MSGELEVLKWAREHGCPWDSDTCTYATVFGHTTLLRWAREHGCPETGGGATHAGAMASTMPSLWRRFQALLAALSFPDGVDEGGRYASEYEN